MSSIKISISTDGDNVASHFGRCPSYTIIDIEDGKLIDKKSVPNPGHSTGSIPTYMNELGVNVMISGGMGRRAIQFFQDFNIDTILGVTGPIETVIQQILDGTLKGGESLCSPGKGKDYGVPKADGHH